MTVAASDAISAFYDQHPYPPPVSDLSDVAMQGTQDTAKRCDHHRKWPFEAPRDDRSILVAGCGTAQAARHALANPGARVVGIDLSVASIEHSRALKARHGLDNLELQVLAVERAPELGESFDEIVCTGVIHHLVDPKAGLSALRNVLKPDGVMHLMVYATYGRVGISMIRAWCRRLGVTTSSTDVEDLVASLRELPAGHPLGRLLRETPDFQDDHALADALLNPRERSYSVPELFDLVRDARLRFSRWVRQAPYLPTCGVLATVPLGRRMAALDVEEQYAAVELFRGTIARHSLIARRDDDTSPSIAFGDGSWRGYVPIRVPTAISVEDRLPQSMAAALLNRAHVHPDLVLFVTDGERGVFDLVDGARTIAEIGEVAGITERAGEFFERLWHQDLVEIDASGARIAPS